MFTGVLHHRSVDHDAPLFGLFFNSAREPNPRWIAPCPILALFCL